MGRVPKPRKEKLDQYDFGFDDNEWIYSHKSNYSKCIGDFLIAFSKLESSVNLLLVNILNDRSHEIGYEVIKNLSYNNKVQLSKDLYTQLIQSIPNKKLREKTEKEFNIAQKKLSELGFFRNKVAHANWMTLDKNGFVRVRIEHDTDGIIFLRAKMTPKIISKLALQCDIFAGILFNFDEKIARRIQY